MSWCGIKHQVIFVSLENQLLTCHDTQEREPPRIHSNLVGQTVKRIFINGFAISGIFLIFVL